MTANIGHFAARSIADATEDIPFLRHAARRESGLPDSFHLDAAGLFLRRSIQATQGAGSAHSWIFIKGWRPAYPETTGYILKTFLRLATFGEPETNISTAARLADWLLTVQLAGGGIAGLDLGRKANANVFNTGMVLLGWNAIHLRSGDEKYLDAGVRAGDFLLNSLDDEGCFRRHTSYQLVHAYNVRAAWALLELGEMTKQEKYVAGGLRNLEWTLRQQADNGFFRNNSFVPGGRALTHSIGYVMSGVIESFLITRDRRYLRAVESNAERLIEIYQKQNRLAAEIDENWQPVSRHICLVGYCQIAIVLMQLWKEIRDDEVFKVASRLIDDVRARQELKSRANPSYGGIPGSFPIYGRYARLQYPNWATKFFADSLMLRLGLQRDFGT